MKEDTWFHLNNESVSLIVTFIFYLGISAFCPRPQTAGTVALLLNKITVYWIWIHGIIGTSHCSQACCLCFSCLFVFNFLSCHIRKAGIKKKMCVALMHLIIFFSAVFCTLPDQPTRLSKTAAWQWMSIDCDMVQITKLFCLFINKGLYNVSLSFSIILPLSVTFILA